MPQIIRSICLFAVFALLGQGAMAQDKYAKTLAAFALGLVLFLVTLGLNVIALRVVRKYREQYD